MDKIKKEQDNRIPFEVVAKEIENALKKHIKDVCKTDIFTELNLIEAYIYALSNITIEYWKKREAISRDAFLRLYDISNNHQKWVIANVLKDLNLYEDIIFE